MKNVYHLSLLCLCFVIIACKSTQTPPATAPQEMVTEYNCSVLLQPTASETLFKASAGGNTEESAVEAAFEGLCVQLPEGERPNCRNEEKYTVGRAIGTMTRDGETSYTATLTLKPKAAGGEHKGQAVSLISTDDACKNARRLACQSAKSEGDCVASGAFRQAGTTSGQRLKGSAE